MGKSQHSKDDNGNAEEESEQAQTKIPSITTVPREHVTLKWSTSLT